MPALPDLIHRIDALLPQTQCTKCGYEGCRPYATAIAHGQAPINRCPPGGQATIKALATLLDTPELSPDPACGTQQALTVAVIDEQHCIGCTLCIQACPVDAIVGANKLMHTILPDQCTGCDLCVAPCPVDCITMVPAHREWTAQDANKARTNHQNRQERLKRLNPETSSLAQRVLSNKARLSPDASASADTRKKAALDALARARARRAQP